MKTALFAFALLVPFLSGCASRGNAQKAVHKVEKVQTFVVIPATAETPAIVQPVTEIHESWEDEQSVHEETAGPDMKQIVPVVSAIAASATIGATGGSMGLGQVLGGLAALAATTAAGWAARQGTVKSLKDQVEYHRVDADEGWRKADERALKLPPS
jgi:hypothetical protein